MLEFIEQFIRAQLQNEFATGGLLLMVLGALLASMRHLPGQVWSLLQRRLITTIDVADHDPAFYWIQDWLSAHAYTKTSRLLTLSTLTRPWSGSSPIEKEHAANSRIKLVFNPAPGSHLLRFHGKLVLLVRDRREVETTSGKAFHESFTFRTFSRDTVERLVQEAQELAFPPEDEHVSVYRDRYSSWAISLKKPPRSLSSVVLADGVAESLVVDVEKFLTSRDWYLRNSIPYQRGYLLHGPPGNGKTSLVVAIASKFKRDVYIARASSTTDEHFQHIMNDVPEHGIVLIEDVDCIFEKRQHANQGLNYLTFSGFINGIDGIAAPQGRILFMTTNHPEKLDEALVRPGRCDRKFHLGYATPSQGRRLYERFFPGYEENAVEFGDIINASPIPLSMAQLQEVIVTHPEDPTVALYALQHLTGKRADRP